MKESRIYLTSLNIFSRVVVRACPILLLFNMDDDDEVEII